MTDNEIHAEGLNDAREAISEQAYTKAQANHVRAYNALAVARRILADAEQALLVAEEELARQEIKPGIPRYAAQS